MLLVICRQRGAEAERLVPQPLFQSMDGWLRRRRSVHAARDLIDPIGSSQGAVPFSTDCDRDRVLRSPLKCEAYTFLAGSVGSLALTLWFFPVL